MLRLAASVTTGGLAGAATALFMVKHYDFRSKDDQDKNDQDDTLVMLAGFLVGASMGLFSNFFMSPVRNSFYQQLMTINHNIDVKDEPPKSRVERRFQETGSKLQLPEWASDPISFEVMVRPHLTVTEESDPKVSQTLDLYTLQDLSSNKHYICPISNKWVIKGAIPNMPLQQAINDWIASHTKANYGRMRQSSYKPAFFNNAQNNTPAWARCEISDKIMKNPCMAIIKNQIRSVDESVAIKLNSPYIINRSLGEAIGEWFREQQSEKITNRAPVQ